jgi:hypothetical protein
MASAGTPFETLLPDGIAMGSWPTPHTLAQGAWE